MIEMDRDRRVRVYALHSWIGVALGFLIYMVCLTGTFAVFHNEIRLWQKPEARLALTENPVPVDPLIRNWIDEIAPDYEVTFMNIGMPEILRPYYSATVFYREPDGHIHHEHGYWNASTGEPFTMEEDGLARWLLGFHEDLIWPDRFGGHTVGAVIVGLAGIFLLLSILTGVLTHRKLIKELFTLRSRRNPRVAWKDAHNVFGVWGLPFHFVIALTGAFLGIVSLMLPILAFLAFGGDVDRVTEVLSAGSGERAGIEAPMISLDQAAAERHPESGQPVQRLLVTNWGDQNALYSLSFTVDGELLLGQERLINGATGEALPMSPLNPEYTVAARVLGMMSALHYGRFAGVASKLMYVGLGIVLTAVIAFGLVVWVERRSGSSLGSRSPAFYLRMRKLISGFCLGMLWANAAVFYLDLFYTGAERDRMFWTGTYYFVFWLLAIGLTFGVRSVKTGMVLLLWTSALAFFALPFVHAAVTGDGFWALASLANPVSGWIDVGLLALGILLAFVAWQSSTAKAEVKQTRNLRKLDETLAQKA